MQQRCICENICKEEQYSHMPELPEVQSIATKDFILFNLDYQQPEEPPQAPVDLPEEYAHLLHLWDIWVAQRPGKGALPPELLQGFLARYHAEKSSPLHLMFDAFLGGLEVAASLAQEAGI